jgi:hypothetical protein
MVSLITTPKDIGSFAFIAFAAKPKDDDHHSDSITNNGEEFVVFSTVAKIIKDNISHIDNVLYAAAEDEANESRRSLYAKLEKYCFRKTPVEATIDNYFGGDKCFLIAKKDMPPDSDVSDAYNALLQF